MAQSAPLPSVRGLIVSVVSGATQFKFRTPQARSALSRYGSAGGLRNRFDRCDSLVGSIGTRCTCR
eukprot:11496255-Alexandrium_andersonii.AAC.1